MISHHPGELSYFISDCHLADPQQPAYQLFLQFARKEARRAQRLYILGDLFEVWIGDDAPASILHEAIEALKQLSDAGVHLYFMHGNRDFLLGQKFAFSIGASLLEEHTLLDLYGQHTLLLHGDSLCTDDKTYQSFRRQVRNPEWQINFLRQSIQDREAYASQARKKSGEYKQEVDEQIMDVNDNAVVKTMRKFQISHMVHGHTHRPAVHRCARGAQKYVRYVLGDWHQEAMILKVTEKQTSLLRYNHTGFNY